MKGLRNSHKGPLLVLILLLSIFLISGKAESRAREKPTITLLPFIVEKGEDAGRGSICPFCKKVAKRGDVPPGSENILTRLLYEKVGAKQTFEVIFPEKIGDVLTRIERGELEASPVASSLRLGRELNADFSIYREANSYPHLMDQGITGNPEELKGEDLHGQAWGILEPHFLKGR